MIRVSCPGCGSDNLLYIKTIYNNEYFKCLDCEEVFVLADATWFDLSRIMARGDNEE